MEDIKKTIYALPEGAKVVPVSISFIDIGMHVKEMYIKVGSDYVPVCRNKTIDEKLLRKIFSVISESGDVYVNEAFFFELAEIYPELKQQAEIITYLDLSDKTHDMMELIGDSNKIDLEKVELIVDDIYDRVEKTDISVLIRCINSIRNNDDYLFTHTTNVAILNGLQGKWLGLSTEEINTLIEIGFVHDLGKLKIPPEILNKPGRLTDEEFAIIKKHPVYSEEILRASGLTDETIIQGALYHHERNNGTGYPDGLKKADIPLFAKITAVSDVYDAMVAQRSYKSAQSPFKILDDFSKSRFSDLDLEVVTKFIEELPKVFIGKQCTLSDGRIGYVHAVNSGDLEYPIVSVDKKLIKTDKFTRCVSVDQVSIDHLRPSSR